MIGTLRSYQLLLITQSQCFSSRTKAAESRASTGTGVARSSRCAAANAFAFAALRPAIPTRSTPGLARRSGTVDWAIAPYPPRMRTFKAHRESPDAGSSFTFFVGSQDLRQARRSENRATARDQAHAGAERRRVPEVLRGESAEERPENRSESLDRVVCAERLCPAVLRSEARHEDGARDVDQSPAESDARVQGDRDPEPSAVRKGRHPDEQERREQHRPAKGRVQLRRSVASTRDPAADPRIHRDRGCLARDVHGEDLRASEAVRLLQENREESVEGGEAAEEEEHTDEIDSQPARQPDFPLPVERIEEMKDANGQIPAPLDPGMNIGDVDLAAIHSHRWLASPHLSEEAGEKPERGANHEERAHRRDLRGEQSRTNDKPCDPEGESGDPANRGDAAYKREPRGPLRPLGRLHQEDGTGGTACPPQEAREEDRPVGLGHAPRGRQPPERRPAPHESDQEEDLTPREPIGERAPQDERGHGREARRRGDG